MAEASTGAVRVGGSRSGRHPIARAAIVVAVGAALAFAGLMAALLGANPASAQASPIELSVATYYSPVRSFSPNGDGSEDSQLVYYCISRDANVTISVRNAGGTVVRTIEPSVSHAGSGTCNSIYANNNQFTWDGLTDADTVAPNGSYTYSLTATDTGGAVDSATHQTLVDPRAPGVLTTPAGGATLTGTTGFVFTPTTPSTGITITSVAVDCLGSTSAALPDGTWRATADTTSCTDGARNVNATVQWRDQFNQDHTYQGPNVAVTIANPPKVTFATYYSPVESFSPNGDGSEDTQLVYYCVSEPSTVTFRVKNSGGTVVRTLENAVAHSQSDTCSGTTSYNRTITWDGKNTAGTSVPNGTHTYEVTATDTGGATTTTTHQTLVDSRVPGVLTTPAGGATLTGTTGFVFTPTTPSTGITITSVAVDCLGSTSAAQPDGTWRASASTTSCVDGAQNVNAQVQWRDQFSQTHTYQGPNVAVTIANPPKVTFATYSAYSPVRSFSPNGDGHEDTQLVYYCVSEPATVTFRVKNSGGTVVRTLENAVAHTQSDTCSGTTSYNRTITWDGKDTAGTTVPNGTHTYEVTATDTGGATTTTSHQTLVDSRVPGVLTTPAGGATLTGTTGFVFTPTTPSTGITITSVAVDCLGSTSTAQPDGTWRDSEDTTLCADGARNINATVQWRDQFNQTHTYQGPNVAVTIANPPKVTVATGYSPLESFSPNGDGSEDTQLIYYCVSKPATVTFRVKNSGGTVVRTLENVVAHTQSDTCNSIYAYNRTITWNGKDTSGTTVPNGTYTYEITATDTSGSVATTTHQTAVDTRVPGVLISPATGDTLAGVVRMAFDPTDGVEIEQLYVNYNPGGTYYIYAPSPDGVWRTSTFAGLLTQGDTSVTWQVQWFDQFGARHNWSGPTFEVTVDKTAIPLSLTASTTTGPAPLATTFTLSASEPNAQPLTYTLNFGDGQSASGTLTAPFDPITIDHTYATPGDFSAVAEVDNGDFGVAQKTVVITAEAPPNTEPTATLSLTPETGTAPVAVTATVGGSDADIDDELTYTLNWGDGSATQTGSLPTAAKTHTYTGAGVYAVRLEVDDGQETDVEYRNVTVGLSEPLAAVAGDELTATVGQPVEFDGSASRPLIGIQTYSWNFGDGSAPVATAQASHTFSSVGEKTVTLTVTSGMSTSTDTVTVDVLPVPVQTGLRLTVTGDGSPLSGADTAVITADGTRFRAATNASGVARLDHLPDGTYTAYAYKSGFKPGTGSVTVSGGSGTATIDLASGQIAQTELTSRRLTYEEIIDAGIDPNDPQNQNVFEFEVHLMFGEIPLSFSGYTSDGGFHHPVLTGGGGGGCSSLCTSVGGDVVYPRYESVEGHPTITWMIIPGSAKWLKEFFEVQMLVTNLADESFTFENGLASLAELPDGLSLAPTEEPQDLVQSLDDIPGGATQGASWIVRGDEEGYYTLSADYSASLEPIGAAVRLEAQTEQDALHVWGGSALEMTVDVDDHADKRAPYRVELSLENVSDTPVYNPEIELKFDGKLNYIYQPKERFVRGIDVIMPGETFETGEYRLVPSIDGTLLLDASFVKKTAGNVDVASTIISHPATPLGSLPGLTFSPEADGVHLDWDPVPGATSYEIFRTPTESEDFPALPVATLSGSTTTAVIPGFVDGFFAVSSVIDGVNTMFHRMEGIPGVSSEPAVVPSITATDLSLVEGDSGTRSGDVEVRLSEPTTVPVTVKVRTTDVSATAPGDYDTIPTTTLVFAPGETVKTVAVTVHGDNLSEKLETFAVKVFDAIGARVTDDASKVTILEDDGPVTISVGDGWVTEGAAGTQNLNVTVSLSSPLGAGQSVKTKYSTVAGTATAGTDFTAVPLTALTFGAGEQTKTVTIPVTGDTATESNETVSLLLTGIVGAQVADPIGKGTIVEDDGVTPVPPLPYLVVEDNAALEGDGGTAPVAVTVKLSEPSATPVTVDYATGIGTATAGRDYTSVPATSLTFAPGEVTKVVEVLVSGDVARELNERFAVRLTNAVGATLADSTGKVTILDEEGPITVSASDARVTEGDSGTATLTYTLKLDAAPTTGETVSVRVATADGSAVEGSDYQRLAPTIVTFTEGQTTKTVTVTVRGDVVDESDEYVALNLNRPDNVGLADSQGRGYIVDDDD